MEKEEINHMELDFRFTDIELDIIDEALEIYKALLPELWPDNPKYVEYKETSIQRILDKIKDIKDEALRATIRKTLVKITERFMRGYHDGYTWGFI